MKNQSNITPVTPLNLNVRTSDIWNLTDNERSLAAEMGLDMSADVESRVWLAIEKGNKAMRLVVESGLLLLSVKEELGFGAFTPKLEELGISRQRASECMSIAKAAAAASPEQREMLLSLTKQKALALSNANPEVIEGLLNDGEALNHISFVEMKQRIKELEANLANSEVNTEKAEAEARAAEKKLERMAKGRAAGEKPFVVEDIELETQAFVQQIELACAGLSEQFAALSDIGQNKALHPWMPALGKTLMAGVSKALLSTAGVMELGNAHGIPLSDMSDIGMAYVSDANLQKAAEQFAAITRQHDFDKKLREYERQQERPKGKGRPMSKPTLGSNDASE